MGKWIESKIEDIIIECQKSNIMVNKAFEGGDYPFYTSGEKILTYNEYLVKNEKIFMSTGGTANVKYYSGEAHYSTDTFVFSSDKLKTKYLYYYLSLNIQKINDSLFLGSGLKHLQKNDFRKMNIKFPEDPNEQEKILNILSEVDSAIDITRKLIDKYKYIKEGLLHDLLTNGIDENGNIRSPETHKFKKSPLGMIPFEWECVYLNDFVGSSQDAIVAGPFGSDLKVSDYCDEGVPLIRLQNVGSDIFIDKDIMYISKKKATELKRHSFKIGDIVLAKLGIPIGKTAIVPVSFSDGIVVADVVRIRENHRIYNKHFLMFMLNSEIGRRQLNAELIGTTRPRVNISQLKKIYVKQPKLTEQNEIGGRVLELDNLIRSEELYVSKLLSIKKGLMQDFLTNTVSVDCLK